MDECVARLFAASQVRIAGTRRKVPPWRDANPEHNCVLGIGDGLLSCPVRPALMELDGCPTTGLMSTAPALRTNSAKREIMVDIWYPADVSRGASKAPLLPGASRLTGISEAIMRDEQFKQAWPAVRSGAVASHAVANAQVTKGITRFPVLIFSPGLGSPLAYTSQLEDFASHSGNRWTDEKCPDE